MPRRLNFGAASFAADFAALLAESRDAAPDLTATVAAIIADVAARGDAAVIEYTQRFDRLALAPGGLRLTSGEIEAGAAAAPTETVEALRFAAARIQAYHERQRPRDDSFVDAAGVELGHRWTAIESVGLYVPGGLASYPSSLLMNAVPARIAGVERIAMAVPSPDGALSPLILAAAAMLGIDEIYRIGGAQAIAALAHGTASVPPVAKIVGPGNAYVAEAKRQVFGRVGIDLLAGPSEILVLADADRNPDWIAIDLLAQAEHDRAAQAILICRDAGFADAVEAAAERHLETLASADIAAASWRRFGALIVVPDWQAALALIDRIAPEHLELAIADADAVRAVVRNAGAIFSGSHTPEAVGDYVAGTNHVLPTGRAARFASGLGVLDFMKRTSLIRTDAAALSEIGPAAARLAEAEGLPAHARSLTIRLDPPA